MLELTLWPFTQAGGGAGGMEWEEELAERLCLVAGTSTCLPRLDQLRVALAPASVISASPPEDGTTLASAAKVYMVEVGPSEDLGSMVPEPGQIAAVLIDAAATGQLLERLPGYLAVRCRQQDPLAAVARAEEGQLLLS